MQRQKQKAFVNKSDFSNLIKNSVLNTKLAILATKAELKAEQDKIVKLQAFDSIDGGFQNIFVYLPYSVQAIFCALDHIAWTGGWILLAPDISVTKGGITFKLFQKLTLSYVNNMA